MLFVRLRVVDHRLPPIVDADQHMSRYGPAAAGEDDEELQWLAGLQSFELGVAETNAGLRLDLLFRIRDASLIDRHIGAGLGQLLLFDAVQECGCAIDAIRPRPAGIERRPSSAGARANLAAPRNQLTGTELGDRCRLGGLRKRLSYSLYIVSCAYHPPAAVVSPPAI